MLPNEGKSRICPPFWQEGEDLWILEYQEDAAAFLKEDSFSVIIAKGRPRFEKWLSKYYVLTCVELKSISPMFPLRCFKKGYESHVSFSLTEGFAIKPHLNQQTRELEN